MEVPLSVETKEVRGKEYLSIWYNKKNSVISTPTKPYFYSFKSLNIPYIRKTKVEKTKLSDYQTKSFYKYEFDTRKQLERQRNYVENTEGKGVVFESHVVFLYRNRIDFPDLFKKYPHTSELKFLFLDIEQACPPEKLFPTYEDRITSISFATNDRKIKTIYLKSKETTSDKKLLELFVDVYKKIDPDVVVCYNKTYDLPVIFERCKINDINVTQFSRNGTKPFFGGRHKVWIDGNVIYDINDSTVSDQSLTGNVPNKKLKTVSDYFGFKSTAKVLKGDEISKAPIEELVAYNKEDVRRLFFLFDIYWDEILYKADDLGIPLSEAVNLNMSDLSLVLLGDIYREKNIIADGSNSTRYPYIFQRDKEKGEGNYQGAIVMIKKRGLFTPVYKADYGSMYPNIMGSFNLSPDTCTLLRYERYKKDGFKIEEFDDYFDYYIPDKNLKKTVVLQVLKKEGFYSKVIFKLLDERAINKKKARETGEKKYKSRSNVSKVKGNGGMYGNQGNPRHPYGFAPAAVGTCGIGRECAKLLISVLEKLYPGCVIETDTDGVYFTAENVNEERILYYFNEALRKKFKKDLNLTIDIDEYVCGYFHKMKNYILLTKKGDIILHGAAFKASSKDQLSKKLINEVAPAKLNNQDTEKIVRKYKHISVDDFELRDFAMQVTMGMHLGQYTERGKKAKSYEMAMRAQKFFNIVPKKGNVYHYVKTRTGYELYQLTKKENIDIKYYQKKVDKIIKMLEAEYQMFTPIQAYYDSSEDYEPEDEFNGNSTKKGKQPMKLEDFY